MSTVREMSERTEETMLSSSATKSADSAGRKTYEEP